MHNFEMADLVRSSAEYNRRASIVEDFYARRLPTEITRFFGYPRSTIYIAQKYVALDTSEKESARPSDFFLFLKLKVWLGEQRFSSNKEVIASVDAYFAEQAVNYYLKELKRFRALLEKVCVLT